MGGGSALGAVILTACVAFAADGTPLVFARLALVALAAAAAFVLDEPAAAAVDAVPRTRRRRTGARATVVALPFAVWTGGVLALKLRNSGTPAAALLIEGAGVLALALALAAALRRWGRNEPGDVVASAVGATILALLLFNPFSRWVPLFPVADRWVLSSACWGALTVAAMGIAVTASGDPFRNSRVLRRRN